MPRYSLSIGFDILLPIVFGTLFVLNIHFMFVVPFAWLFLLLMRSNSRRDQNLSPLPLAGSVGGALIFGTIVAAAASYEPTKTRQKHLNRELTFSTKNIELAELAFLTSRENEDRHFTINYSFCDADKHNVIHLTGTTVTLQQLLDAIERDTGMKGEFHSCGNGYSVLQGVDWGFGLSVHASRIQGETFDVYEYAYKRATEPHQAEESILN